MEVLERHLEAGGSQLLRVVVQDVKQRLVLDARHLQDLSRAVADVARVQRAQK
jgi:hypothetical protein